MQSSATAADNVALKLCRWNERYRSPRHRAFLAAASFGLSFFLFAAHTQIRYGLNTPPAWGHDELDYDSIGWELAQGNGFQHDFTDPAYRAPYVEAGLDARLPPGRGLETVAYRPPVLPALAAAANLVFGRQFFAVRLLNTAAMAAVCGLAVWTVFGICGPLPALIVAFNFVLLDERTRVYARALYTESIAALVIAAVALLLIAHAKRRSGASAAAAGMVMGLGVLVRTMFGLWLPVVATSIPLSNRRNGTTFVRRLSHAGIFLAAALFVMSPWVIRNLRLLEGFQPLGTQARIDAASGYSDEVFAAWGEWRNLQAEGVYDSIAAGSTGIEWETRVAMESMRRAKAWAIANWYKLPALAAMKVVSEFRPLNVGEAYLSAFALLGLIALRRRAEAWVGLSLIAAAAISIALTWSVEGRFIVPLLYVIHVFAAVGLWISLTASLRWPDTDLTGS